MIMSVEMLYCLSPQCDLLCNILGQWELNSSGMRAAIDKCDLMKLKNKQKIKTENKNLCLSKVMVS